MEIEQLRQFLRIAEANSFTQAAKTLAISQSALSRSIGRLEEDLGRPVFERQSRQLVLTDAGRFLQDRARQIVELVDDTRAQIADDGVTGNVRLGAEPTIAPFMLPRAIEAFRNAAPEATLVVTEDVTERVVHLVQQGDLDVALIALPLDARYLEVEPLFDDELLLAVPSHHPLSDTAEVSLTDLSSYPFVLLHEAHCLTDNVRACLRESDVEAISVERTNQLATVLELVALGHGISLIPKMASQCDESPRRVYRHIASTPTRTIGVLWNRYRFNSQLVCKLLDMLRKSGAAWAGCG